MPLYVIHALDKPDHLHIRLEQYPAHRAYLGTAETMGIEIKTSGPLVGEDGTTAIGSLFIIEAANEPAARRFNAGDPFAKAGLWAGVNIQRFDMKRGAFAPKAS